MLVISIVAFIIGVISGLVTFIFGLGINLISEFIQTAFPYNLILLPIVGLVTVKVRNDRILAVGSSMPRVFAATGDCDERLSKAIIPYQIIMTWLSHLSGASVGREGVAVQLGATIANVVSTYVPEISKSEFTRIGMAAGFAGLFGTPLAASVFCFEVTRKKNLEWQYIIAALIACYSANLTSTLCGLNHFHVTSEFILFNPRQLILFIFCIAAFVYLGQIFARLLAMAKRAYAKIEISEYLKIVLFSIVGAGLLLLIAQGRYMSLGTNIINDAFLNPSSIQLFDFIFKLGFTVYFVAIGFQGGEVTPLFAMGSSLGVVLAYYLSLPIVIVAGIGYAFTFGAATNAYITAAVLAIEVFGVAIMPYALIALIVTLLIKNNKYSIYPNT